MTKVLLLAGILSVTGASAQQVTTADDWCRGERWDRDRSGVCEVREFTLPATGATVNVDASPNGGIAVEGGSRGDILVQARVVARADTEDRARQIAAGVQVAADPGRIHATGPTTLDHDEGWHVSYRLFVPTATSVDLQTRNGGISLKDVEGQIAFRTVNGGVKLARLAGDVRGSTRNGGVDVDLDGAAWRGGGLDVETQNGGVRLAIPEHYSARLETGTVNGGLRIDFPVTVQGRLDRQIEATLGAGGPLVRVRTRNGGVRVTRK